MFRNIFKYIEGVNDFPIYVMVFFFIFFVSIIVWALSMKKNTAEYLSKLPLDNSNDNINMNINGAKNVKS